MFGIDGSEFLVIAVVALLVIGPKDLPRALYKVGQAVGKARAMSRHVRSGFDEMVRQAELEDLERKWAEQNRLIMAETAAPTPQQAPSSPDPVMAGLPAPSPSAPGTDKPAETA